MSRNRCVPKHKHRCAEGALVIRNPKTGVEKSKCGICGVVIYRYVSDEILLMVRGIVDEPHEVVS